VAASRTAIEVQMTFFFMAGIGCRCVIDRTGAFEGPEGNSFLRDIAGFVPLLFSLFEKNYSVFDSIAQTPEIRLLGGVFVDRSSEWQEIAVER
jgi:hypothetical protein